MLAVAVVRESSALELHLRLQHGRAAFEAGRCFCGRQSAIYPYRHLSTGTSITDTHRPLAWQNGIYGPDILFLPFLFSSKLIDVISTMFKLLKKLTSMYVHAWTVNTYSYYYTAGLIISNVLPDSSTTRLRVFADLAPPASGSKQFQIRSCRFANDVC
jgi:hypothetical protein